ncbi:hypothetical protein FJZ36_17665 [Candidatus Poribacteria bacterium]|nr:hypothetical protein [Candidatus Poribacteria bacterium]
MTRTLRTLTVAFALTFITLCAAASAEPAWIDGTPILSELFPHPPGTAFTPSAPARPAPPRFEIGSARTFFAVDFRTTRQYTVDATLRAVGEFCYIYVADDQWNRRIAQGGVDRLLRAFEQSTPGDPARGIYQIESEAFGNPPDMDGDPRIVLLLLDILDNFQPGGSFIAGYFSSVNQLRGRVRDARWGITFQSNETEMVYLDTNPGQVDTPFGWGILAHEFQHLIHYGFDPNEDTWVNEGASDFAMFLVGYPPTAHKDSFESDPTISLTEWPSGMGSALAYYGATYLWMLYLYERAGGLPTIRSIVQSPRRGMDGVDTALRARGFASGSREFFSDWRAALIADDSTYGDGRYGFVHESVNVQGQTHRSYPVAATTRKLRSWSGDPIEFSPPRAENLPLQVAVTAADTWREALDVQALLFRGTRLVEARRVPREALKTAFTDAFPGFGEDATRIALSVSFAPLGFGTVEGAYGYSARLGKLIAFDVRAFRNPILRDFIEVAAVPDSPVETGAVTLRLTPPGGKTPLAAEMTTHDGGKTFGATFRVPGAAGDWAWELVHFEQVVGRGTFRIGE